MASEKYQERQGAGKKILTTHYQFWQQHSHPIELNTWRQLCKTIRKFNGGDVDLRNGSLIKT